MYRGRKISTLKRTKEFPLTLRHFGGQGNVLTLNSPTPQGAATVSQPSAPTSPQPSIPPCHPHQRAQQTGSNCSSMFRLPLPSASPSAPPTCRSPHCTEGCIPSALLGVSGRPEGIRWEAELKIKSSLKDRRLQYFQKQKLAAKDTCKRRAWALTERGNPALLHHLFAGK